MKRKGNKRREAHGCLISVSTKRGKIQIEDARRAYDETKAKYEAVHYEAFRDYVRKSGEAMVERRFLILHQALTGAQTVRALLGRRQQQP